MAHQARHRRKNPHVLAFHRLFTDRRRYSTGQLVRLFGVIIPDDRTRARCSDYHCVAVLRPVGLDQSWSVVLRPWSEAHSTISRTPTVMIAAVGPPAEVPAPDRDAIIAFLGEQGLSPEDTRAIEAAKHDPCLYYGEFASDGVPSGSWRH